MTSNLIGYTTYTVHYPSVPSSEKHKITDKQHGNCITRSSPHLIWSERERAVLIDLGGGLRTQEHGAGAGGHSVATRVQGTERKKKSPTLYTTKEKDELSISKKPNDDAPGTRNRRKKTGRKTNKKTGEYRLASFLSSLSRKCRRSKT